MKLYGTEVSLLPFRGILHDTSSEAIETEPIAAPLE